MLGHMLLKALSLNTLRSIKDGPQQCATAAWETASQRLTLSYSVSFWIIANTIL